MAYEEYYYEFITAQNKGNPKYIMFAADIKGSRKLSREQDKERVRMIREMDLFIKTINSVDMSRIANDGTLEWLILGDSFLFAVEATEDLEEVQRKFDEFLEGFPFEYYKGKARFDVAVQTKENYGEGLAWYYCWPFLEDMIKYKERL